VLSHLSPPPTPLNSTANVLVATTRGFPLRLVTGLAFSLWIQMGIFNEDVEAFTNVNCKIDTQDFFSEELHVDGIASGPGQVRRTGLPSRKHVVSPRVHIHRDIVMISATDTPSPWPGEPHKCHGGVAKVFSQTQQWLRSET
jgi:hypothetical protein